MSMKSGARAPKAEPPRRSPPDSFAFEVTGNRPVMSFADWNVFADRALIATAVHNGHGLRPEVSDAMALDEATRLREEDPHTGRLAGYLGSHVVVNASRFQVDLNRPEDQAVYTTPDDAWGLELWRQTPAGTLLERSRAEHRRFYQRLHDVLAELVDRHGGFVLYDIHSYNHRRSGPDAPSEPAADNPVINLGTGSLPPRWKSVAEAFLTTLGQGRLAGERIDARENVRFRGRYVAQFVHDNFGEVGCALAIEAKKVFMDEWTNEVDDILLQQLGRALAETAEPVLAAWEAACP